MWLRLWCPRSYSWYGNLINICSAWVHRGSIPLRFEALTPRKSFTIGQMVCFYPLTSWWISDGCPPSCKPKSGWGSCVHHHIYRMAKVFNICSPRKHRALKHWPTTNPLRLVKYHTLIHSLPGELVMDAPLPDNRRLVEALVSKLISTGWQKWSIFVPHGYIGGLFLSTLKH